MADFVQKSIVKSAVRELTTPITDAAAFAAIPAAVISGNPFGCTSYESGGVTMDPVTKTRETYGTRVIYQDDDAKTVGSLNVRAPTTASFATIKTELLADAEITAAMGGDPANQPEDETYTASLRCHDPSGETYTVTFTRTEVRVTSYSDDAILAVIEAWADTVPALA